MSTQDLEASMRKSVEATQRNFNTIRTGRANSSLLDRISVEYYGAETPLKSLATLSTPDSQTCLLYTSPSPRDRTRSRMPSSA